MCAIAVIITHNTVKVSVILHKMKLSTIRIRTSIVIIHYYRPQRSWAKVMFLQASVILSTGGGRVSGRENPPGRETPPAGRPPGRQTPLAGRPPRDQTPLGPDPPTGGRLPPREADPPGTRPLRKADSSIRSMSGRYASYWNAFLCGECFFSFIKF